MPADVVLTWEQLLESCSRLHTTRLKPRWPGAGPEDMREASAMLNVWIGERPAVVVPTRMHEPGFYVRYEDGSDDHQFRDPDELVGAFRDAVDAGTVSRRG